MCRIVVSSIPAKYFKGITHLPHSHGGAHLFYYFFYIILGIFLGLAGALNTFQQPGKDSRFNKDKDKYGVEIAEQLSFVRGIWKTAKLHSRSRWAKDAAVRRKLEGDIERLNVHQSSKHAVEQERVWK